MSGSTLPEMHQDDKEMIEGQSMSGTDLHDCTHEEQIDEFEIVDREEIFDECDEQTNIQRHQMNVGLNRHPKSTSEMFNVFNRSGSSQVAEM